MERLTYIDTLKGIGIILVVVGHLFTPFTEYLDNCLNQMIYSVHMPLFFFLSGYVFGYAKNEHYSLIIVKKIISLLLPYFAFGSFYCYIKDISWTFLYFETETHNGYWFTLSLFFVTILGILVDAISNKFINPIKGVKLDLILQLVFSVVLCGMAYTEILPNTISTIISFDKIAKFYIWFQMGKYVSSCGMCKQFANSQYILTFALIIYIGIFFHYGYALESVNAFSFVLPLCGILILFNFAIRYDNVLTFKGILPFVGRKSLDIYLIHLFFISPTNKAIVLCTGVESIQLVGNLLIAVGLIVVSLLISYLLNTSEILTFLLFGRGRYAKILVELFNK